MDCIAEAEKIAKDRDIDLDKLRTSVLRVSAMLHIPIYEAICSFVAVMNWPDVETDRKVSRNV